MAASKVERSVGRKTATGYFGELAAIQPPSVNGSNQSVPVLRSVTLNDSSDRKQLFRGTGARRVHVARPGDHVQPAALSTGGWNMHALPLTK